MGVYGVALFCPLSLWFDSRPTGAMYLFPALFPSGTGHCTAALTNECQAFDQREET